jgi:hypothetical protein
MEPQDDPEARIRELERPLAETARTSELSAGYYTGSPYTSAPPYGGLYAPAPRKVSAGFPWWVFAVIVLGVVVLGAGLAFFSVNATTRSGTSVPGSRPSLAESGGPAGKAPSGQPRTPGGVTTAPPGAQVSVAGIAENKTIACNDNRVSVSGVSNTVRITGHCLSLTVSGVQNQVTVDGADTISASGFNNRVVYHSGSPEINDAGGSDNSVKQG